VCVQFHVEVRELARSVTPMVEVVTLGTGLSAQLS